MPVVEVSAEQKERGIKCQNKEKTIKRGIDKQKHEELVETL